MTGASSGPCKGADDSDARACASAFFLLSGHMDMQLVWLDPPSCGLAMLSSPGWSGIRIPMGDVHVNS